MSQLDAIREAIRVWEDTDENNDLFWEIGPVQQAMAGISVSDAAALIRELVDLHGCVDGHYFADRVVIALLRTLGGGQAADVWDEFASRWYYS